MVDKNVDAHGTRAVDEAYLAYLYSDEAQQLIAKNHYRTRKADAAAKVGVTFPALTLFTIDEVFGGWPKAHAKHFADGAEFDGFATGKPE